MPSTTKTIQHTLRDAFNVETMSWRRAGHGSSARPQRPDEMRLRQPQDGAQLSSADRLAHVTDVNQAARKSFGEPEDARLTGGTRSLMRRVMGLNVMKPLKTAAALAVSPATRVGVVLQPRVA